MRLGPGILRLPVGPSFRRPMHEVGGLQALEALVGSVGAEEVVPSAVLKHEWVAHVDRRFADRVRVGRCGFTLLGCKRLVVVVQRQIKLLEVVLDLPSLRCFSGLLNGHQDKGAPTV